MGSTSGLEIKRESANYVAASHEIVGQLRGHICNWRIDFVYKDENGEYMRERGPTVPECGQGWDKWVGTIATTPKVARYGKACAELFANGKLLAAQCHDIVASRTN